MIRKAAIVTLLAGIGLLTSCSSNVAIQSQEMPPTEQEWANTLVNWYPKWKPPVVVHKNEQ